MKRRILTVLVALHVIPVAAAEAREHVPGCKTDSCDKRIGKKWSLKHRPKPSATAVASWYGPGLYGNKTACGQVLQPGTVGVAHKSMGCGTKLRICLQRCVTVPVIDRGPYVGGRTFDLTAPVKNAIGMGGIATVRYAVVG